MKHEKKFMKQLKENLSDDALTAAELAEKLNAKEELMSAELDRLVELGYCYVTHSIYKNNKHLISPNGFYSLTCFGKDYFASKRDEWIKFWIPVTISIIALGFSIYTYITK